MTETLIIIVNFNGAAFIDRCLNGVRNQTFNNFATILVDNGSADGSLEFVQNNYPEVKTIALGKNMGFAAANNIAIRSARTQYVALLNNDAVPHPEWLASLVKAAENRPEAGLVASKMLFFENHNIVDRVGDDYTVAGAGKLRGRGESSENFNEPGRVFGACAGAALYRRRLLEEIGLFDEDFFLLYEDVDLSFRAQLKGYKCIYAPEAIVYHRMSGSIGDDSPISVYFAHRNLEWTYIHNMPKGLIKKTICQHLLYDLAAFCFFVVRGRGPDFIKAKWHALRGLKRALAKRRQIQKNKTVSDDYIWSLFEKERLLPRLTRRLSKNSRCDLNPS